MSVGPWESGENVTSAKLNLPGLKQLARRQTTAAATTTIVGILRLDDLDVKVGRAYMCGINPQITGSITADTVQATVRHTTDGSTPTTASAILPGMSIVDRVIVGTGGQTRQVIGIYEPAADQTLSLLACIARLAGTGNVTIAADATSEFTMWIQDVGPAVGNTGVSI